MSSGPAPPGKNDEDKSRVELLRELKRFREQYARQQDVADRLGECEEKFRAIADNSREAITLYQDGRVVYANNAAAAISGYSINERLRMNFADIIHPDYRELARRRMRALLEGESHRSKDEYKVIRKDGEERWVLSSGSRLTHHGKPAVIVNSVDITESKRDSHRESEAMYRELVEKASIIILRTDRNGNITFINEFARQFFGYDEGEIIGKSTLGTILPASDSEGRDLEAMMDDLLKQPEEYRTNVNVNMRKNGERVWVSWANQAFYDDNGNMAGLLSIGNDITRLMRAEKALQDSKFQAELYLDLMSHDINNMHQIALGYLELAREIMVQANESQVEYLDKPIEVLQRSSRLISNVRKMQKLLEGEYQARKMDVCRVLHDVRNEYGEAPHKPVILDLNDIRCCHVMANELLYDVFSNLVVNAIKHTGERAYVRVELGMADEKGKSFCRVFVEDDGPGVPDDFKKIIFNRMLKGTAKAKGMGLGLYLVKSLVDSYGGRVWVEDRVMGDHNKGARFVVLLPVAD